MKDMFTIWQQLYKAVIFLIIFSAFTGLVYPFVVTGIAHIIFPYQSTGSLIYENQSIIGSELIGQQFDDPGYFWGRLSATSPFPYNSNLSSGSNYSPSNLALTEQVEKRIKKLKELKIEDK